MGLILRRNLNRPLTWDELDNNQIYLDIVEWTLKSYEKGMWVYFKGTDDVTVLYLCETTHDKSIYPSGVFAEVINTVRIWRPFRGGGTTGTTYFENPLPTTASNLEGIPAGSTFSTPHTMQEMWDQLLYPYQAPAFTSFYFTGHNDILEVGESFTGDTAVWTTSNSSNVVSNSVQISGSNLTTVTSLGANGSRTLVFDTPVVLNSRGSKLWQISGVNTHSAAFTRNYSLSWEWRFYWGESTAETLTESEIKALRVSDILSDFAGNYAFDAGGYKYICIPDVYCTSTNYPANFWDYTLGLQVGMNNESPYVYSDNFNSAYYKINVTNEPYGITTEYRVYRTKWQIGLITIIVS